MKKKVYTIQLYDKYRFNLEKIIIIAINEEDALEKLKKIAARNLTSLSVHGLLRRVLKLSKVLKISELVFLMR